MDPTILWDAMKAVIRGKLIAETAYVKRIKSESHKLNNEKLRHLEREHQNAYDPKIYQEIKEMRAKINDVLADEIEKKNKFLKQSYYEAGSKAAKVLAKRIRKQQVINNIHEIRHPKTD